MEGFNKCPNGHYYPKDKSSCPYCRGGQTQTSNTSTVTEVASGRTELFEIGAETITNTIGAAGNGASQRPTEVAQHDANATFNMRGVQPRHDHTQLFDDIEVETDKGVKVEQVKRSTRKLVGWLVTYTFDPLGISFSLYEGKNTIGRSSVNSVPIPVDSLISDTHATLLFRNDSYLLKDEFSTHGTYVNDKDIADEHYKLQDGDVICLGNTVLKFRSSL